MEEVKKLNPEVQHIVETLLQSNNGQLRLGKKTTAHILGLSVSTLDRNRYTLLPFYQDTEKASNVLYSVYDIANYLHSKKVKVLQEEF